MMFAAVCVVAASDAVAVAVAVVADVSAVVVHAEKFMWIDVIFGITYSFRQCLNVIFVVQLHVGRAMRCIEGKKSKHWQNAEKKNTHSRVWKEREKRNCNHKSVIC